MRHWIQNHILQELTHFASRRYSQLRPQGVEGNLFMYHLNKLITADLVEKRANMYALSKKGLVLASRLSLKTGKTRLQPRILTTVVCQNSQNEYLFIRWRRQPNIGLISFPHGMLHFGARVADMAALELAEKANLQAKLAHVGDVFIHLAEKVHEDHFLVHVFTAKEWRALTPSVRHADSCNFFWASLDNFTADDFVPGFYEIAQLMATAPKQHFFEELSI